MNRASILTLILLLLAGCSSPPRRDGPAPVIRSSPPAAATSPDSAPAAATDEVEVRPYLPAQGEGGAYEPPVAAAAAPAHGEAVVALLESADRQQRSGDLTAAASTLERALRIEPRNPWLWSRLAGVRLRQGRYGMAEQLAAKSNSLAGDRRDLRRRNWELIARARSAAGDAAGAAEARRRLQQP